MKIAIAVDKNMCSEHFGHCEEFKIYELENNKIIKEKVLKNPGHKPGFLPNYLNEIGINLIISTGMGENAQNLFKEKNIDVIVGISGSTDVIINKYLNGNLRSDDSICNKHQFEGKCNE